MMLSAQSGADDDVWLGLNELKVNKADDVLRVGNVHTDTSAPNLDQYFMKLV
jgi:hypothetical protein